MFGIVLNMLKTPWKMAYGWIWQKTADKLKKIVAENYRKIAEYIKNTLKIYINLLNIVENRWIF